MLFESGKSTKTDRLYTDRTCFFLLIMHHRWESEKNRITLFFNKIFYKWTNNLLCTFKKGGVQNMNAKIKCFLRRVDCTGLEPVSSYICALTPSKLTVKPFFVKCKYPMLGLMPYVIHAARITHEWKIQRMSNLLYRLHHSCSRNEMSHMANTGNETRTRMVFSPLDFKSSASTIPPCQLDVHFCTSLRTYTMKEFYLWDVPKSHKLG